jgi:HK97 family phage major capsid protein
MINLAQLERDLDAKRSEGLALVKKTAIAADAENRVMTDDETAAIHKLRDEGLALQDKIGRLKGVDSLTEELSRLTSVAITKPPSRILKSLGEQFVGSDAYEFFRKGLHRTSATWRSPSTELFHAATLTEDPASGGALVVPDYRPGIVQTLTRPLAVADLLAPGTTESNMVSYMSESAFTNNANAVAEGAAKPESVLTFTAVQDPVRKIAHWLPVTEEMLEDVPQIRSYIDSRLRLGVELEEDDELLNGTGVAPELLGLRNRPGLATAIARGADTNADALFKQIMALYSTAFLMPTGIVLNPTNWSTTVLTKTTTGEYITGGPFSPIQTPTMWGLPVAVTPAQPVAEGLVGAFKTGAQIFRKGGMRVEASNSHQDFFIKNLVAIRAEERLALAVYRPGAIGKVTGLN